MNPFEVLYTITTFTSLAASIPQIQQLLITKRSDELNMTTWSVWLISQFVFLMYAATSFARPVLIVASCMWLVFYGVMIYLIAYYRRNPGGAGEQALQPVEEST